MAKDIAELGARRLAELLADIADSDPTTHRRLLLELAGIRGPAEAAREIRKRISAIKRSKRFLPRGRVSPLVADLEALRSAIIEHVSGPDPDGAMTLMWHFVALADSVFGRIDDSDGVVIGTFHTACADLGRIAADARPDPLETAEQVHQALQTNHYGQYDPLIGELASALGDDGLAHLHHRMTLLRDSEGEDEPWSVARLALLQIADTRGDVDAFVAQYDEEDRRAPGISVEIAHRLLDAGRPGEALAVLDGARHPSGRAPLREWADSRITVLDALGRVGEAQADRWSYFERHLSEGHLRQYLSRHDGFDQVDVEDRALTLAQRFTNVEAALGFLVSWPAPGRAAALVLQRADEIDGNRYQVLGQAVDVLAVDYPLAATLLLRSMIDFSLSQARSTRYRHAARHLEECERLAVSIDDFASWEDHEEFVDRLREEHGRKSSFWRAVDGA